MKNHIIVTGIVILGLFACKSQDSVYEEFLVPNGLIYPAAAQNVTARPGNQRIEISWTKSSDTRVTKARIFWNNYADSDEVAVNRDLDTIRRTINNLEEGTYSFVIRMYDSDENASVPIEVFGRVYGKSYVGSLSNRWVKSAIYSAYNNSLTIDWYDANQNEVGISLTYTDIQNNSQTMMVASTATRTTISDFNGGSLLYITLYKPHPLSIDVFHAPTVNLSYE